ncbi:MAG: hypothetical protein KBC02_03435 [Candidatus Pacebacteria bacterium]|nr:hypothetical protein [Candidatus Paceibacterota bacterium]
MTFLTGLLIDLALIIVTVVSFIFVVSPWMHAKDLQELFSLNSLPQDKLERVQMTPYLKAALQKFEYDMKTIQAELRAHLELPDAVTTEEVTHRVAQYRYITARLSEATHKHKRAHFLYTKYSAEPDATLQTSVNTAGYGPPID